MDAREIGAANLEVTEVHEENKDGGVASRHGQSYRRSHSRFIEAAGLA